MRDAHVDAATRRLIAVVLGPGRAAAEAVVRIERLVRNVGKAVSTAVGADSSPTL